MKTLLKRRTFAALLSVAMLGACATHTPPVVDTALESFRPLSSSTRDTCATQRDIAAHNSVYDTLKAGKRLVYRAPCDVDKNKSTPEAKTS